VSWSADQHLRLWRVETAHLEALGIAPHRNSVDQRPVDEQLTLPRATPAAARTSADDTRDDAELLALTQVHT